MLSVRVCVWFGWGRFNTERLSEAVRNGPSVMAVGEWRGLVACGAVLGRAREMCGIFCRKKIRDILKVILVLSGYRAGTCLGC